MPPSRFVVGPEGQTTITELGRGVQALMSVAASKAFLQEDKDPKSVRIYFVENGGDSANVLAHLTEWVSSC